MASSYSPANGIELPADGEKSGLWGQTVNNNVSLIEEMVGGRTTVTVTGNVTLSMTNGTTCEARHMVLELTGSSGAARQVVVPAVEKFWIVYNNTTGGYDHTVKTASGTGVVVPNGKKMAIYCDGTNVVEAISAITGLARVTGETLTGPYLYADGSASAPSMSFSSDTNTGVYRSGADVLNISAGGSSVAAFGTGGATLTALTVSGATTMTGALTANGNVTLGDAAGDSLTVTATSTFASPVTFNGNVTVGDASSDTLSVTSTASFLNDVTLGSSSADTLTVNANATFSGSCTFSGVPTFTGNVTVGDASADALTVVSTSTFQSPVTIQGAASLSSTLAVTGAATLSSSLTVSGATTLNGNVVLGDATGDAVTVTGNTTVGSGTLFTKQSAGSFISHGSSSHTSGVITVSTASPSGGSNGDIWFQIS